MDSDNNEEENSIEVKAILLGDVFVGKTSLINVSIGREFDPGEQATISSTFVQKKITIDNQRYCINLWDTAGQEKLKSLTKLFFKGSKIVIFVYDITEKKTFINLKKWVEEVENTLDNNTYISGIAGNKQDLYSQEQVNEEDAIEYANSKGMKFRLVSAKEDPKSFNDFIEELVKDGKHLFEDKEKDKIQLKKEKKKKDKCNC